MSYPLWHSFIFITLALSWLLSPTLSFCHSGYSYEESTYYNNTDWMAVIRDDTRLDRMSIPGTHDSSSRSFTLLSRTQTMDIETQLNSGIRYVNTVFMYLDYFSDFVLSNSSSSLMSVIHTLTDFLDKHPSETILLSLNAVNPYRGEPFELWNELGVYLGPVLRYIWRQSDDSQRFPTLGEIRNKIVLIHESNKFPYGLMYPDLLYKADDNYLAHNWKLHDKWLKVKQQLHAANDNRITNVTNKIFVNWLGGWGGSFPYFVVSGHVSQDSCAGQLVTGATLPGFPNTFIEFQRVCTGWWYCDILFLGTNMLAQEEIVENQKWDRVGVVITDFPGPGLIDSIISVNRYNAMTGFYPGKYFRVHPGTLLTASLDLNVRKMVPTIWDSHEDENQVWIFDYVASKKYYIIRSYYDYDLALTWDGTSSDGGVTCSKYNDGDGQHWLLPVSPIRILNFIVPYKDTSLALTFKSRKNGSQIIVSQKKRNPNISNPTQEFMFKNRLIFNPY